MVRVRSPCDVHSCSLWSSHWSEAAFCKLATARRRRTGPTRALVLIFCGRGLVGCWEHVVLGLGHGGVAHAILPKELVEDDVVGGVGVAEIEIFALLPFFGVRFVNQAIIAIAVVGGVGRLRTRT